MASKRSQSLLERMKKLVEEQDHLLDVELKKERELDEATEDITQTTAYKRMAATKVRSNAEGGSRLVRAQEKFNFKAVLETSAWDAEVGETEMRDQDARRSSTTEEMRE